MKCRICGLENPPEALICDCGYNFELKKMPSCSNEGWWLGSVLPTLNPKVKSEVVGFLGFVIMFLSRWLFYYQEDDSGDGFIIMWFINLVGLMFVICGVGIALQTRSRNPWNALLVILACVGWLIIISLYTNGKPRPFYCNKK